MRRISMVAVVLLLLVIFVRPQLLPMAANHVLTEVVEPLFAPLLMIAIYALVIVWLFNKAFGRFFGGGGRRRR